MEYLFLPIGNDSNRYVAKEELYNEAKKYINDNIYKSELEVAISEIKTKCKDEVVMIVRQFLCIWRCTKFLKWKDLLEC